MDTEMELNMDLEDISGNHNERMFEAYNSEFYSNSCTNICDLENNKDKVGNYNLNDMITIGVKDEFNKYSFCLNSSNNLYKDLDNKFSRMKDYILEQFKSTEIFIDSLDMFRTWLSGNNYEINPDTKLPRKATFKLSTSETDTETIIRKDLYYRYFH